LAPGGGSGPSGGCSPSENVAFADRTRPRAGSGRVRRAGRRRGQRAGWRGPRRTGVGDLGREPQVGEDRDLVRDPVIIHRRGSAAPAPRPGGISNLDKRPNPGWKTPGPRPWVRRRRDAPPRVSSKPIVRPSPPVPSIRSKPPAPSPPPIVFQGTRPSSPPPGSQAAKAKRPDGSGPRAVRGSRATGKQARKTSCLFYLTREKGNSIVIGPIGGESSKK